MVVMARLVVAGVGGVKLRNIGWREDLIFFNQGSWLGRIASYAITHVHCPWPNSLGAIV